MSLKVKLSALPVKFDQKAFVVGKDNIYTTGRARFAQSRHPLVSYDANSCVMLGLNGGDNRNCLMHIAPEQQPLSTIKAGLGKCIQTLAEKMCNLENDITGILIGGRHSGNKDSFLLFNEIAKTLDEFGIPFSMICGKFNNIVNDNIVMTGDKTRVWNKSLQNLEIPQNNSQENIAKILEQNYEVVELVPEVPVEFIG